jgi:hypothetical protein
MATQIHLWGADGRGMALPAVQVRDQQVTALLERLVDRRSPSALLALSGDLGYS